MMQNFFDQFDGGPQGVQIKPADPGLQYEGPKAATDLRGAGLTNEEKAATLPYVGRKAKADAETAEAGAVIKKVEADEAVAGQKKSQSGARDQLLRVIGQLDNIASDAQDNGGWGETGFTGARLRNWEGTAAFDLQSMLNSINANLAFQELQKMRAESPTGGALGNVTEKELELLRSTVADLNPNQSQETFLKQLATARKHYTDILGRVDPETATRLQQEYDREGRDPLVGYVGGGSGQTFGPSGPVDAPPPPTGGAPRADERDTFFGGLDAFGRNFANAGTLNLADRIAAGGNALLPIDNLFGANNRSVWDGSTFGQAFDANMDLQRRTNAADRQVNPIASTAGDVSGSLAGMIGANQLLRGLGAGGLVARTGGAAGDVGYWTARGGVEDGARGALVGGGSALAGGLAGRYLIAPAIGKAAATRPGQAVINMAGRGANAVANAGRGLIGRGPQRYQPVSLPQALSGGERTALARVPTDVGDQLSYAQQAGLPMALADTSPQLQALAGSVVRKSPDAYAMARDSLGSRALGQADRAQEQIGRVFGPLDNPNRMAEKLTEQARTAAGPLYREAYAQPSVSTPELESLLKTPFAREAVGRAEKIAANERRDPRALGFARNEAGDIVLNPSPINEMDRLQAAREGWDAANSNLQAALAKRDAALSPGQFTAEVRSAEQGVTDASRALDEAKAAMQRAPSGGQVTVTPGYSPQTLDYTKRGMDDVLERYRNPITHRLDLDEAGRAENAVLRQFLSEVDANNPAYQMARQAYGGPASMRTALGEGRDVLNKAPRDIADQISGYSGPKLDMYRLGARTAMSDAVDKVRYSSNPYQNIYGSPVAQERAATVFGRDAADEMRRVYDAEQRMAQTAYDTLGGSPTAMRAAADEAFDNGLPGLVLDAGTSYLTGSGGQGITQKALTKIVDNARLRGSKKRADQLAPLLFETNPERLASALKSLKAKSAARDVYVKGARKVGGLFGASLGGAITPALR